MEVHLMTEMMSGVANTEDSNPVAGLDGLDEQLISTSPRMAAPSPGAWKQL
jgi:hypothetical protein